MWPQRTFHQFCINFRSLKKYVCLQYLFHKSRILTDFLKDWEAEIGGHEWNVKVVVARNCWVFPVAYLCKKNQWCWDFRFSSSFSDFIKHFCNSHLLKNDVRRFTIGKPIVNAIKWISSKWWRFLSSKHFPLTYGLHIPRARSTIFL